MAIIEASWVLPGHVGLVRAASMLRQLRVYNAVSRVKQMNSTAIYDAPATTQNLI